eukprot:4034330-Prymnesium_polylepis.1
MPIRRLTRTPALSAHARCRPARAAAGPQGAGAAQLIVLRRVARGPRTRPDTPTERALNGARSCNHSSKP